MAEPPGPLTAYCLEQLLEQLGHLMPGLEVILVGAMPPQARWVLDGNSLYVDGRLAVGAVGMTLAEAARVIIREASGPRLVACDGARVDEEHTG